MHGATWAALVVGLLFSLWLRWTQRFDAAEEIDVELDDLED